MPLASATGNAAQNPEQLGLTGWNSMLVPGVALPAATPGSAVASTLLTAANTGTAQAAAAAPAPASSATTGTTAAGGYPAAVDPSIMARLSGQSYVPGQSEYPQYTDPATGLQYFGRYTQGAYGGEGSTPTMQLSGYSVGNYDTVRGGNVGVYDTAGKYTGQNEAWKADSGNYDSIAMGVMGAFMGAFAAAAAAGGGAASAAGGDTALAVQGNSINALDNATGVAYGSEAPGSLLTGPTSVNADYSLLTGNAGPDFVPLEGNAGQGVNVAARSGEGLAMNTSPNMATMGGGQGLTTTGAQALGESSSFVNDPALNVADAGKQVVSEPGVYTPQQPYTPDLGDPASPINGGPNPWPAPPTTPLWDQIKGLFTTPAGTSGSALPSVLPSVVPAILQQLLTPKPEATPAPVAFTPPQPEVGAGAYTQANAQGGAAGSMAGVASTLLTARDTFGYGRTMLA